MNSVPHLTWGIQNKDRVWSQVVEERGVHERTLIQHIWVCLEFGNPVPSQG